MIFVDNFMKFVTSKITLHQRCKWNGEKIRKKTCFFKLTFHYLMTKNNFLLYNSIRNITYYYVQDHMLLSSNIMLIISH